MINTILNQPAIDELVNSQSDFIIIGVKKGTNEIKLHSNLVNDEGKCESKETAEFVVAALYSFAEELLNKNSKLLSEH